MLKKLDKKFLKLNIWSITVIFFICWLPNAIAYYPIRFGGGANNQIIQIMGDDTAARNMSKIIYEGHYICAHHPVLLTWFYGAFFKIGHLIGHINLMCFILSLINILICAVCMSYSINTIAKYVGKNYIITMVLICIIYPMYGIYAHATCKDNIYVAVLLVFETLIFKTIVSRYYNSDNGDSKNAINNNANDNIKKDKIIFTIVSVLIPFLKNQGIYIVVLSLIVLAVFVKENRKEFVKNIILTVLIYTVIFNHIMFPALKIAPGGIQEMFSLPFQQTARYFIHYKDQVTDEEREIVDKILPTEKFEELYIYDNADPVKFKYKKEATKEDLLNYFKVYLIQFKKHPKIYLKAFTDINGRYYLLNKRTIYIGLNSYIYDFYGMNSAPWVENSIKFETEVLVRLRRIPLVQLLFRCAFFFYFMVVSVLAVIFNKKYRQLIIFTPFILSFLVMLISPINGDVRYTLPLIYGVPVFLALIFMNIRGIIGRVKCVVNNIKAKLK